MKNRMILRLMLRACVACVLLMCICAGALAYDGTQAGAWLQQFAESLTEMKPLNDPMLTADPARAGQYLIEYDFGTVLSRTERSPQSADILEIDLRTQQIADARGVCVGMGLDAALAGRQPYPGEGQLSVLDTQPDGYGWSWAYLDGDAVYGVEYITYDSDSSGAGSGAMKEYTLTYVISDEVISAIRFRFADATLAQAQEGMETAEEIAALRSSEAIVFANHQPAMTEQMLHVMGEKTLGEPVAALVSRMGEPDAIQTLPEGGGRILMYDGAAVALGLNEATGEEVVRSVSVSNPMIEGPNRLMVGMSVQEAGGLVRCDRNLYSRGGLMYLEGEALGEAPYGELSALPGGELLLAYACICAGGETALLQAGIRNGNVAYWQVSYQNDAEGGV